MNGQFLAAFCSRDFLHFNEAINWVVIALYIWMWRGPGKIGRRYAIMQIFANQIMLPLLFSRSVVRKCGGKGSLLTNQMQYCLDTWNYVKMNCVAIQHSKHILINMNRAIAIKCLRWFSIDAYTRFGNVNVFWYMITSWLSVKCTFRRLSVNMFWLRSADVIDTSRFKPSAGVPVMCIHIHLYYMFSVWSCAWLHPSGKGWCAINMLTFKHFLKTLSIQTMWCF